MTAYKHAPIQEAVIDLQLKSNVDPNRLEKVVSRLKETYPAIEDQQSYEVRIDNVAGSVNVNQSKVGYKLSSDDRADVVLLKSQAITTARLAPYEGWEYLYDRARSNWGIWEKTTRKTEIQRIGVRYINRLDIPFAEQSVNVEDYVVFSPRTPNFSDQPLLGHSVRIVKPLNDVRWICSIMTTFVDPAPLINHLSVLLDIDVYRTKDIPLNAARLWDEISSVRGLKNMVFESCVTDKARNLFNK